MNKVDLQKLKRRLKEIPGFRLRIKKKTGFSLQYIDFVLNANDKRFNQKIIDAAFEVLEEYELEQKKKEEHQNRILSQL